MFFYKRIIIIELIVFMVIGFQYWKSEKEYEQFPFNTEITGIAKIVSNKEETENKNKYVMKYKKYKFILYTSKELQYGDIIKFKGYFEKAKTFNNFHFSSYVSFLKEKKIYGFYRSDNFWKISIEKDFIYYIENFKMGLKNNLYEVFEKEKAGFLAGLLIGDKAEILDETKRDFQDSSLSHILAISGLHVIYVSIGMENVISIFIKKRRVLCTLMIILLILFAFFTGGSPSCLRACIMCSIAFISEMIYRKNNSFIAMMVSLDIILLINCYYIYSFSLWLSFFATFGILYFRGKVNYKSLIIDALRVSFVSNLMTFPIICNRYNSFSLTFLISNLFVSILIGPIILLGYIHLFLGKFSSAFTFLENALLDFVFLIAKNIGNLRISKISVPSIPIYFCILYYIVLLCIGYLVRHKDTWKNFKKQILCSVFVSIMIRDFYCYSKRK